ncbi:uncharacterized protein Z520_05301 [Fonsecaea multimorphosa CBS 102226]|uniref:Uncharacterized protein n=1 Tax=Fonsecaea multimorphosa CBS 102226 TaxID=1442371 RepID=A0A0D2HAE0_9EURO|nr:uncharacterized protein Z520_05301 [Fonsecaea multimorphosa CBS 102226]KIX98840.1 hypothetical protein Z520_05301 [Fonsecaea multimorphosa CBS 102226]OAL25120.1 hypothetical protein AYO22_04997 [Fonsecaea multimorphosa]
MDYSKSRYAFQTTPSARPSSASLSSRCSVSEARQLAYQIGTMSRSKIQKEAAKTVPHLHRLVCHAAVFDNAAKFIVEHMRDYSEPSSPLASIEEVEDVDDEDDFSLDDIVDIVPEDDDDLGSAAYDPSLHTAQVASFNGYAQLKSPRLCGVVVTTTVVGSTRDISHWDEAESDSSSSTESEEEEEEEEDDSDFDFHYDYADPGCSYFYRQSERHADWEYAHTTCSKPNNHTDDDQLLWSQQPRVWSPQQAANIFVEAFG